MQAKEFREKDNWNKVDFFKGEYDIDLNSIDEYAEAYHQAELKLLGIGDVSQQRELLLAYHRYLTEELSLDLNEIWVDEHLKKSNNCG